MCRERACRSGAGEGEDEERLGNVTTSGTIKGVLAGFVIETVHGHHLGPITSGIAACEAVCRERDGGTVGESGLPDLLNICYLICWLKRMMLVQQEHFFGGKDHFRRSDGAPL